MLSYRPGNTSTLPPGYSSKVSGVTRSRGDPAIGAAVRGWGSYNTVTIVRPISAGLHGYSGKF